jgi:hypothetical protein
MRPHGLFANGRPKEDEKRPGQFMEKSLHQQPQGRDAQKFRPAVFFEHHKLSVNTTALLAGMS